jgi:hypothetical protein
MTWQAHAISSLSMDYNIETHSIGFEENGVQPAAMVGI